MNIFQHTHLPKSLWNSIYCIRNSYPSKESPFLFCNSNSDGVDIKKYYFINCL